MSMKRQDGGEQPHIKIGMFKLRIPFVHATPTFPEAIQGMCNGVLCMGSVATIMLCTGVSEEAAYGAAFMSTILYMLNNWAGDATVCGWIMPAVPLVTMFCQGYPEGDRIKAMAALQIMLAIIYLFLGATGLARKIVGIVPPSIKGGIVLGAAISSIYGEYREGGRFWNFPITIAISTIVMIFVLYSPVFLDRVKKGSSVAKFIAGFGLVPAVVVALIVAHITGESPMTFSLFPLITIPNFAQMWNEMSPFAVGFPSATMFLGAIPTALAIYIVAFSDTVVLRQIVKDGTEARKDEYVEFNVNRVNITAGLRNLVLGLVCPFAPLASPLGAAFTISMLQGYSNRDQKSYYSVHGGAMSENYVPWITMLLTPIVSLFRPVAGISMSLCLVSQGFSCTASGAMLCRNKKDDLMIAGAIAAIILAKGAAWGLGVGLLCYFLMSGKERIQGDLAFNREELAKEDELERQALERQKAAA